LIAALTGAAVGFTVVGAAVPQKHSAAQVMQIIDTVVFSVTLHEHAAHQLQCIYTTDRCIEDDGMCFYPCNTRCHNNIGYYLEKILICQNSDLLALL
jgi:hypothetical protein